MLGSASSTITAYVVMAAPNAESTVRFEIYSADSLHMFAVVCDPSVKMLKLVLASHASMMMMMVLNRLPVCFLVCPPLSGASFVLPYAWYQSLSQRACRAWGRLGASPVVKEKYS